MVMIILSSLALIVGAGIDCPGDCQEQNSNAPSLTATPDAGPRLAALAAKVTRFKTLGANYLAAHIVWLQASDIVSRGQAAHTRLGISLSAHYLLDSMQVDVDQLPNVPAAVGKGVPIGSVLSAGIKALRAGRTTIGQSTDVPAATAAGNQLAAKADGMLRTISEARRALPSRTPRR